MFHIETAGNKHEFSCSFNSSRGARSPVIHGRGIMGAASSQPLQVIESVKILIINKKQFSVPDVFTENVNSAQENISFQSCFQTPLRRHERCWLESSDTSSSHSQSMHNFESKARWFFLFLLSHISRQSQNNPFSCRAVDFEVHSALGLSMQCNPSYSASSVKPLDSYPQTNSSGRVSEVFASETG